MAGTELRPPSHVKLTYDDLLLLPDDGLRHELIDGRHYVAASPNVRHQQILGRLHLVIGNWLTAHPVGQVFFAPLDVVFTRFDVVVPDLLFISNARAAHALNDAHAVDADLIVEIASPSTRRRDLTIKRRLYEQTGVSEYWFIDPDAESIHVYRRSGERFASPTDLTADQGHDVQTPLLPGLSVSLVDLFHA